MAGRRAPKSEFRVDLEAGAVLTVARSGGGRAQPRSKRAVARSADDRSLRGGGAPRT